MTSTPTGSTRFSDVHLHLQDTRFGKSMEEVTAVLTRARERGAEKFVVAATSPGDWNKVCQIGRANRDVYVMLGSHPWHFGLVYGDWQGALENLLDSYVGSDGVSRAGLGEVGLDFAIRDCDELTRKNQIEALRFQLDLANTRALPVALHCVRANDEILKIMRDYTNVPAWLLHGWHGSVRQIQEAVELGAFFSFSARSVSPNSVRTHETIVQVPRDRILLESDSPYPLPPNGYAGMPAERPTVMVQARDEQGRLLSEPSYLPATAEAIAKLRKIPVQEFYRQLNLNERRFFLYWPRADKEK